MGNLYELDSPQPTYFFFRIDPLVTGGKLFAVAVVLSFISVHFSWPASQPAIQPSSHPAIHTGWQAGSSGFVLLFLFFALLQCNLLPASESARSITPGVAAVSDRLLLARLLLRSVEVLLLLLQHFIHVSFFAHLFFLETH